MKNNKIKLLFLLVLSCILIIPSFVVAKQANAASTVTMKVNITSLNMRSGPSTNYKVVKVLKKGTTVTKVSTKGTWTKVKSSGKTGWVSSKYLKNITTTTASTTKKAVAKVSSLNIRKGAGTSYKSLGKLSKGTTGTVLAEKNGWVQIKTSKYTGWVSKTYLTITTNKSSTTSSSKAPPLTPAATSTANVGKYFTVNVDSLNVRKSASASSTKLGVIKKNKSYKILAQSSNNWVKITYTTGKTGWISASTSYGKITKTKPTNTDTNDNSDKVTVTPSTDIGKYFTVTADSLNVRKSASATATKLSAVVYGSSFKILDKSSNNWFKITYATSKTGWVSGSYGKVTQTKPTKPVSNDDKNTTNGALSGKVIVVDAGHGGTDPGAVANGVLEKDLNLQAALALRTKLQAAGATVKMTRTTDIFPTLYDRVSFSIMMKPDAFISLHHDSATATARGFTVLYTKSRESTLATYIQQGMASAVPNMINRGYKPQDLYVLRENPQIGVLVELGFITNLEEVQTLKTDAYRNSAANGITNGLINYFN
ncbi:SH3 domain-containing protein [Viridibacillus sp. YIM B01967]|uniref:SH3 domain-containing protein n=1 Tax=Viridibacillus soli TaxID=2798301 RepID=A0ABS1HAE0_9BACL|nr:SH3 domain-containing protein [Viridibacillus soli]MBK3496244.1 SH3 domain-containing protein [Viridibacillus soli]